MSDPQTEPKKSGAGFFHIDRRTWKMLCGRNDINQVVSYLVIAAGTGAGNRVSRWSAKAVEIYTGLHSGRAKTAITALISGGYLRRTESSQRTRPIYELLPFEIVHEVAVAIAKEKDPVFSSLIEQRTAPKLDLARYLLQGLIWRSGSVFSWDTNSKDDSSDLIWLPNTLRKTARERHL